MEQSSSLHQKGSEITNLSKTESQGQEGIKFSNVKSPATFSISRILNIGSGDKNKKNQRNNDIYNPNLAMSLDSVTLPSHASKKRHKLIAEPEEPNRLTRSDHSIAPNHWNISNSNKSFFRGYLKEGETDNYQYNHTMSPPLVVHEVSQSEESTSSSPETKRMDSLALEDGLQANAWHNDDSTLTRSQILLNPHYKENSQRIANTETLQSPTANPHNSNLDSPLPIIDMINNDGNNEHNHANILETDIDFDNTDTISPCQSLLSFLETEDIDNNFLHQLTMANLEKSKKSGKTSGKNNQRSSNELSDMERGGESFGTTPFSEILDDEEAERNDQNNEVEDANDMNQMLDEDAVVSPVSVLVQLTSLKHNNSSISFESITDLDYGYFCDPRSEFSQDIEIIEKRANRHANRWTYIVRGSILLAMLFAPLIYHRLMPLRPCQFPSSQFISPSFQTFEAEKALRKYSHPSSETTPYNMKTHLLTATVKDAYGDQEDAHREQQLIRNAQHNEKSISDGNPKPNTTHQTGESNNIQPIGIPLLTINNRINNKQQLFPGKTLQIQQKLKEIRSSAKSCDSFIVLPIEDKLHVSSRFIRKMMKVALSPVTIPVYSLSRCLFHLIQLLLSRFTTHHHYLQPDELDLDFSLIL